MNNIKNVSTLCSYCGTGCGIQLEVEDNRITSLEGDPSHPTNSGMLCTKGRTLHQTINASDRLLFPQVRQGLDEPFEEVSLDSALDYGTSEFARIIREHGPEAVAFYISGQLLTEDYYVFNKLMKGFIGCNNIDTNSRLCMSSASAGYERAFGVDGPPTCYEDINHADCLFIFGANTAFTHPIIFRHIEAAKEEKPDMKVVVVDPRQTDSCSIADAHIQLMPGTDVVLLQAMLNVLIWEGMIDRPFIEAHTKGFESVCERAREITPLKAAEICKVDAAQIIQAAYWFVQGRTLSLWSMGFNQSTSGTDKNNALINLHLATGMIGKPGCGPFSLTGQPNAMGGREVGATATTLSAHRDIANPGDREEMAHLWEVEGISEKPGLTATEIFDSLDRGKVKAIWIVSTNPMVSFPDTAVAERAMKKAELVIVSEAYHPTDTTRYAHILLPAAGWAEKEGTMTNSERRISHLQQALVPPGECMPDWKIAASFATRLGGYLGRDWSSYFDYESPESIFEEHKKSTEGRDCDIMGLSYRLLDEEGPQQWPFPAGSRSGKQRLYEDKKFHTSDERACFIDICYREVAEPTDAEYPLALTTGRIRDQWHTMTKTGKVPSLMQHDPIPYLFIHPEDAETRGLKNNDLVRIASRRSEVIKPVKTTEDMKQSVLFLPMHWGATTTKAGRVNSLVSSAVDPISKEPEFKHTAVEVERFNPAWRGIILMTGDHLEVGSELIKNYSYGVVSCLGMAHVITRVDIACEEPLNSKQVEDLDNNFGVSSHWESLIYTDRNQGIYKRAWLDGDFLKAVRFIEEGSINNLTDADWIRQLLLSGGLIKGLRPYLLASGGSISRTDTKGDIICTCMYVGKLEIEAAMQEGATTVDDIKNRLSAGTGCCSCVPEIKRILRSNMDTLHVACT